MNGTVTLAEVTNAKSVNVAKAAKAEEKRNAAVAKIVDTARSHTAHAKDVAAEVEARRKTDAEEAREVAEELTATEDQHGSQRESLGEEDEVPEELMLEVR